MELFKYFDKINKISDDAKEAMRPLISQIRYHKNEIVQEIGSRCKTIYMIKSGCARIYYYKDGKDITEQFAFENDIIVRAESLFTSQPTAKGIQTLEETEMIAINSAKLFKLYDDHHEIERLFRIIFEREYVNSIKRLESIQFNSAKERYLELIKNKKIVLKIPLKHIATYLGITQVSLSRIRAEML
jgi:CRP-like cAMP-binding protein